MNTHSLVMAAEVDAADHVSAGGGGAYVAPFCNVHVTRAVKSKIL